MKITIWKSQEMHLWIIFGKGSVTPSQHVRTEQHPVWIAVSASEANRQVKAAWCSCMAGHSQSCNHTIAVMYTLEYATTHGFNI